MNYETPQFYKVMQYAARADRDVVDLVSGSPDWGPPAALRDGLRAYADVPAEDYRHPPSEGIGPLREEIAHRHAWNAYHHEYYEGPRLTGEEAERRFGDDKGVPESVKYLKTTKQS